MARYHLATFRCDVTPPPGHPLCGGWIEPVRAVEDKLQAIGVAILGSGAPIIICAVDWVAFRNDAHDAWRKTLARAAQTTPDRVLLTCVHPHDSPFVDLKAQEILEKTDGVSGCMDIDFFNRTGARLAKSVADSLGAAKEWTQVGIGKATVQMVASNRRVLGPTGQIRYWRGSSTSNAAARAEPEGLIDPALRTLSFWNGDQPLAAIHCYATHPMSHYGKGQVSCDFCGLARDALQKETPGVLQIYMTGCAGNIAAGKYNDGAPANRRVLRDRMLTAMRASWLSTSKQKAEMVEWRSTPVKLPPRREASFGESESYKLLRDPKAPKGRRGNAAFQLSWLARQERPIDLGCLDLGAAAVVHLPGEPFIEHQLALQRMRPGTAMLVPGYGDDGPGYLPTAKAYGEGGYETTVALAGPEVEDILLTAGRRLLKA